MMDSLKEFSIDAVNLSAEDFYAFLAPEGRATRPRLGPPLVSANVDLKLPAAHELKPYVIRTVQARAAGGTKPLRVGIAGIADPGKRFSEKGVSVQDPV